MKKILVVLCGMLIFLACNTKKEIVRMKKSLAKKGFIIDTLLTSSEVIRHYQIQNLELKLNENGKFNFINEPSSFSKYEGTWDLSDDNEISYFIFRFSTGETQKSRNVCFNVDSVKLYFKEKK